MDEALIKSNGSWEMQLNGFRLSRSGLVAEGDPSIEDWQAVGQSLREIGAAVHWWIGDWLLYGEHRWGETYAQALDATDYEAGTLRNDVYVCRNVDLSRRRDNLSFAHHYEVAGVAPEKQSALLEQAERGGWSSKRLRREVQGKGGESLSIADLRERLAEWEARSTSECLCHEMLAVLREFCK